MYSYATCIDPCYNNKFFIIIGIAIAAAAAGVIIILIVLIITVIVKLNIKETTRPEKSDTAKLELSER